MSNSIDAADRMPSSEIERILADSKKAHDALAQLHRELEEQISVLDRQAFSRGRKQSKPPIYDPVRRLRESDFAIHNQSYLTVSPSWQRSRQLGFPTAMK